MAERFFAVVGDYLHDERPRPCGTERVFVALKGARRGEALSADGLDEILDGIEAVTREDLQSLSQQYFQSPQIAVTVLGPLNDFTLDRSRLAC